MNSFFSAGRAGGAAVRSAAAAALLSLGAVALPSAHADVTFGGDARNFAMGGVGVALNRTGGSNRFNPATLMTEPGKFSLYTPSLGTRASGGLNVNDVISFMTESSGNETQALGLARKFSQDDSDLGINANVGVRVGPIEILATGVGKARILPSADLKEFVSQNGTQALSTIPAGSGKNYSADVIAAGVYTLPTIGMGFRVPKQIGGYTINGGVRVKLMNAVYSHYIVNEALLRSGQVSNTNDLLAPEMMRDGQKKDILTKSGVGVDLGFLAESQAGLFGAIVVNNLIKPDLTIEGVTPAGTIGQNVRQDIDFLATTISLGAAYSKNGRTLAADLVDITGAVQSPQLRFGAEQRFGRILALRAGYSTGTGFAYGLGIFGFDVAFGTEQPLEIVRTLKF